MLSVRAAVLHEFPVATAPAAGRAMPIELAAMTIDHLGEIPALHAAAIIFAIGDHIAAVGSAVPVIAASNRAPEAVAIRAGGRGPVVAVHVPSDGIAGQATQKRAADNAQAVAMACKAAQNAAATVPTPHTIDGIRNTSGDRPPCRICKLSVFKW